MQIKLDLMERLKVTRALNGLLKKYIINQAKVRLCTQPVIQPGLHILVVLQGTAISIP